MVPLIQTLLTAGANPSARNDDGKTALDLAREFGFSELAAWLDV
ncbi:MAG: ankyrin repeat domain-containing protein [Armatimonadota bacterium]|nr:ankyrin repeat domain-containing protein [Armatimonadota bacterium]